MKKMIRKNFKKSAKFFQSYAKNRTFAYKLSRKQKTERKSKQKLITSKHSANKT